MNVFTSNLRTAGKADRYRWTRGVGGGMLGLGHSVGLVDCLATAELSVFSRGRAEAWSLVVSCLEGQTAECGLQLKPEGRR